MNIVAAAKVINVMLKLVDFDKLDAILQRHELQAKWEANKYRLGL